MDIRELDERQLNALKEFRKNVKDCKLPYTCDTYLLRWLIARDFDIVKAEKMLRNSLECRRGLQVDEISSWRAPEVLTKYFPVGITGVDKFNNTMWISAYGQMDLKSLMESAKKKDFIKFVIQKVEESLVGVYQRAKPTEMLQQSIVFDMDGFSMGHITNKAGIEACLELVQYYEANYPELLFRAYIINAPRIFSILWSMVTPFLHEKTARKVQIFGSDAAEWKAAVLETVDPSQLPACYGGSLTDPDGNPRCLTRFCMGGQVPKSYYLTNSKPDLKSFETSVCVSYGSKEQLVYHVKEADSTLRWQFYCQDGDIAFSICHKKELGTETIVPRERVDCCTSAEEGEIVCTNCGDYVVEFDNTYSYIRSKKIWFTVTVTSKSSN